MTDSTDTEWFLKSLREMPAPPCDTCPWAKACIANLACTRYAYYVEEDPPQRAETREGWEKKVYINNGEVPTREIYDEIFRSTDRIHRFT